MKIFYLPLFFIFIALSACSSKPIKEPSPPSLFNYVDSTEYFAERTGSVSMRAVFNKSDSVLAQGYKFQFRTISTKPVFLNSVSIIAGGKRVFLEEGQIVLPSLKGITLQLSLEDSLYIASFPSALLQFRQNNQSEIYTIELHQIEIFKPL